MPVLDNTGGAQHRKRQNPRDILAPAGPPIWGKGFGQQPQSQHSAHRKRREDCQPRAISLAVIEQIVDNSGHTEQHGGESNDGDHGLHRELAPAGPGRKSRYAG